LYYFREGRGALRRVYEVRVSFASYLLPSGRDLLVLIPDFVLGLWGFGFFSGLILVLFVGGFVG
jgi:hypothetical protein